MFDHGQEIELIYPTTTHIYRIHDAPRRLRQLRVHRVRDLLNEPLTIDEYARRPFVSRSRWLITAAEYTGQPPRQFYVGSADNYRSPSVLRLGLYDPDSEQLAYLIGRQYEPTIADRRELLRFAREQATLHPGYDLRIFASDLRLIS